MGLKSDNYAVVLAGGQGSRFWPQSRTLEPKQFLSLHKDFSLFEQTLSRLKHLVAPNRVYVVTSSLYEQQVNDLASKFSIPGGNLIFEPEGKNTAPSIALAANLIFKTDEDAKICVLPCDHLIKNDSRFIALLSNAFQQCHDSVMVLGIPPTRPSTGYGYIKAKLIKDWSSKKPLAVDKFCEKPDLKTAERFLKQGCYFWNSGIFIAKAKTFILEFKDKLPKLYSQITGMRGCCIDASVWHRVQPISFDYGVLERTDKLNMLVASNLGWSDLGSWQAWDEVLKKDKFGNLLKADVINIDSKNLTVVGNNRLIATIGLDDLIVVDTPDALLISKKDRTEEVKKVVDTLKKNKREEFYSHKTVKRPWGQYTIIGLGEYFKIKLVEVNPGKSLSLQLHNKRSEHWVVVEGQAVVVKGKSRHRLNTNESLYVPMGCVHRLINPANKLLRIVEVQTGKYLGEDDIIRLKDVFGRICAGVKNDKK